MSRAGFSDGFYLAEEIDQIDVLVPSHGVTCLQPNRA